MGAWENLKDVGNKVGKAFPIVYYPTKWAIDGGRKLADGDGGLDSLTGGSDPINPNFDVANYGGSEERAKRIASMYRGGMKGGREQVQMGIDRMNSAGGMGQGLAMRARDATDGGLAAVGSGMGTTAQGVGMANQDRALQMDAAGMQRNAALGLAPSQAEMLMRANADTMGRRMVAQASNARGGNQAAAMAGAQASAHQMSLEAGQQTGALRAQEMAQARGAYGDMGTQMRGQDLGLAQVGVQQSGMGSQLAGIGYNAQAQGIGALQSAGQGIAGVGQAREANYLDAYQAKELAELQARTDLENTRIGGAIRNRESNRQFMGGLIGTGAAAVGTYYGGPAGGAAGYQAGNQAGRSLAG